MPDKYDGWRDALGLQSGTTDRYECDGYADYAAVPCDDPSHKHKEENKRTVTSRMKVSSPPPTQYVTPKDLKDLPPGTYSMTYEDYEASSISRAERRLLKEAALRHIYGMENKVENYDMLMPDGYNESRVSFSDEDPMVARRLRLEDRAARMLAQADQMRRQEERRQQAVAKFGPDDYPYGAVILFDKQFVPGGRTYQYAAIKTESTLGGAQWSTTGPKSPKSYTWKELTTWMADGVAELYYVTEAVKVDPDL